MRVFLSLFLALLFSGCAEVMYKDVYVPVACPLNLDEKPEFDGSFESAKELMGYFLRAEEKLKICIGE